MSDFLKCDAPDCDHFEITPVTIDVVDKPCPKCGANLCTKEDFVLFKTVVAARYAQTEITLRENPDAPVTLVAVNTHNGTLNVKSDAVFGENPFPNAIKSDKP